MWCILPKHLTVSVHLPELAYRKLMPLGMCGEEKWGNTISYIT